MQTRLSISNIAWNPEELDSFLDLIAELGCDGVELAPSLLWAEPAIVSNSEIKIFRRKLENKNLVPAAFHALLFTRPELKLFDTFELREQTINYLLSLIRVAGELGVSCLIFGSPASRKLGKKTARECYLMAVEAFRQLGREARKLGTCFCIEPLGPSENEFITSSQEAWQLVQDVEEPGFGLHLDTKAMHEVKENYAAIFAQIGDSLKHLHVSEPGLAPIGSVPSPIDHQSIAHELKKTEYRGFISIEMRRQTGDNREQVKKAIEFVRKNYFASGPIS